MEMDGRLFLGTARFLRNNGSDEAAFRSAVSRAYYACFLAARDVLFAACGPEARSKEQIRKERDIRHEPLQRYLKYGSVEKVQEIGEILAALHGNRKDADYDMKKRITADDAEDAIEEADYLINLLSEIPKEEVGKAIDNYVRTVYP
ncbi:MAG: HEPN domain-containing protein [Deltaproteobacteria bacterium]|nr:HEPN domain-containing protein [Deltaproteobacteria bacterium]MBW2323032.1 HEPN domain-containing protein [Deltaproteobacteria bacterium]